jgi:hypothetical protein
MARRGRGRTRTVTRYVKRGYSRRKGLLGGNTGKIVIGAAAGFFDPMIPNVLGGWTKPIVYGAAGYVFKKPALLTVAGFKAGQMLASGGIFGKQQGNGGMFE